MEIIVYNNDINSVILNETASKQIRSRLKLFYDWLQTNNYIWITVDIKEYLIYLSEKNMATKTILSYWSTIKSRYKELCRDRNIFYSIAQGQNFVEKKNFVDELITRINNKIDSINLPKEKIILDEVDDNEKHHWLEKEEIEQIFRQFKNDLIGTRDKAIFSLFLATGCRESEIINAKVCDIQAISRGEICFKVSKGKNNKQRLVPYGGNYYLIKNVIEWLKKSNVDDGFVFRRVYKSQKSVGKNKLTAFAIQKIIKKYNFYNENGEKIVISPHDLRRTYAKQCYNSGMKIYNIQLNLGHSNEKTTKMYIGNLPSNERAPESLYSLDLKE